MPVGNHTEFEPTRPESTQNRYHIVENPPGGRLGKKLVELVEKRLAGQCFNQAKKSGINQSCPLCAGVLKILQVLPCGGKPFIQEFRWQPNTAVACRDLGIDMADRTEGGDQSAADVEGDGFDRGWQHLLMVLF